MEMACSLFKGADAGKGRLVFVFGLLIALQWCVFMVMVAFEVSSPSSLTGRPRDLRMADNQFLALNRSMVSTCFTDSCLEQVAQGLARIYPNRSTADRSGWCITSKRRKDAQDRWQGLILVKGKKTWTDNRLVTTQSRLLTKSAFVCFST